MSLEKVAEEIVAQAKREAEKINEESRREAERIILSAKNTIEEKRNKAEAETALVAESMMKKEIASAKLDEKRLILDTKKEAIGKAYSGLEKKILSLDRKPKEKIYARLAEKAGRELEPAYVYARAEDAAIAKRAAGKAKVMKEEILGGLIFESADKKVRIDMSFDGLLSSVKSGHIKDVSKILFGEGA